MQRLWFSHWERLRRTSLHSPKQWTINALHQTPSNELGSVTHEPALRSHCISTLSHNYARSIMSTSPQRSTNQKHARSINRGPNHSKMHMDPMWLFVWLAPLWHISVVRWLIYAIEVAKHSTTIIWSYSIMGCMVQFMECCIVRLANVISRLINWKKCYKSYTEGVSYGAHQWHIQPSCKITKHQECMYNSDKAPAS